tara:strand:- start:2981 stop:4642 length:1662 start_codon:yes stop_codon:yes gene_type:complete
MTDYLVQFDAFSQEQCKKFLKQRDFRKEQLQMGIVTVSLDGNGITTLPPMSKKRFKHNLAVRFGDVSDQKVDALYNDSRRGTRRQSFSAFGGSGAEETDNGDNGGNPERPESPVDNNPFSGYADSIPSAFHSQVFEEAAETDVESEDEMAAETEVESEDEMETEVESEDEMAAETEVESEDEMAADTDVESEDEMAAEMKEATIIDKEELSRQQILDKAGQRAIQRQKDKEEGAGETDLDQAAAFIAEQTADRIDHRQQNIKDRTGRRKGEARERERKITPSVTDVEMPTAPLSGVTRPNEDEPDDKARKRIKEVQEINQLLFTIGESPLESEQRQRKKQLKDNEKQLDPDRLLSRDQSNREIQNTQMEDDEGLEITGALSPEEALAERNSRVPVVSIDDDEEEERPRRQPVTKVEFKGAQKRAETRLAKAKETKLDNRLKITNLADIGGSELVTIREETDESTIIMPDSPFSPVVKLESDQNMLQISDRKTGEKKNVKLTADKIRQIDDMVIEYTKQVSREDNPSRVKQLKADIKKLKALRVKAQVRGVERK